MGIAVTMQDYGQKRSGRVCRALSFLACSLFAWSLTGSGPAVAESRPADVKLTTIAIEEAVRPLGRFRLTANKGLEFAWPGSGAEFAFDGSQLQAVIKDKGKTWLDIETNGTSRPLALKAGTHRYTLIEGSEGRHVVRMTRRTEPRSGRTTLLALRADGKVSATPAPDRGILVIGDSISAGYGVEDQGPDCRFSFATENHNATYAALAARAFGAELHSIAVSGRGLLPRSGRASAPTMADSFGLVFPGGEAWPSDTFRPAAVIVHLGTNDFYGRNPRAAFVTAYTRLLTDLAARYPDARLYAAFGPMLSGADRENAEAAIAIASRKHAQESGRPVPLLLFGPARSGHIYGCNWHPGRDSHIGMAKKLVAQLSIDLGWAAEPLPAASPQAAP